MPLPQVQVFQEFNLVPAAVTPTLSPLIFGPEYQLHRYAVPAEKVLATTYTPGSVNSVTWSTLSQAVGSVVDSLYTVVTLEQAYLQYWFETGSGASSSVKNQVRLASYNLVSTNGTVRDATLYNRDVQVGDGVTLSAVVSSTRYTVNAVVTGFVAEVTNPNGVVASATADPANQATVTSSTPGSFTSTGLTTAITVASSGTYNGIPSGYVTETYTVSVTQASTGGNLTTAILNIVSSSGTDNVLGYVPAATFGSAIPIGTRGLLATFTLNAAANILVGDVFTITVRSAYTAPTIASGGTYTGLQNTTYVLTCIIGGNLGGTATFSVSTNNAADAAAPITPTTAVAIGVGNYGVTFTMTDTQCRLGDKFLIACTASTNGAIKTIIFNQSLPTQLTSGSPALDVTFYVIKPSIVLPPQIEGNTAATNWTQDTTGVHLQSAAYLYEPTWRSGLYGLPVTSGNVFITWRELVQTHVNQLYSVTDTSDLTSVLTTQIDPDNPLGYAANKALLNSNGTPIWICGVSTVSLTGFQNVLNLAEASRQVYSLVPLTHDTSTQQAVSAHCTAMSSPENGLWRICFLSPKSVNPAPIVTSLTNNSNVLATVATYGGGYEAVLTSGSLSGGATFSGVQIGDTLRINYGVDAYDNPIYQSIAITGVIGNDTVTFNTAPSPAITANLGVQIEIYRQLTPQSLSAQIGTNAGVFASNRTYAVYPDTVQSGGVWVHGSFLCAAIAGLVGGVVPQQGLTNVQIVGFDNMNLVTQGFNRSQLDSMAAAGVWIVTQDPNTGMIYTRQELSTDQTDIDTGELMVVKNVDSISYVFSLGLAKYIGRANVTPSLIDLLTTDILAIKNYLIAQGATPSLGGQLIDLTIQSIAASPLLQDQIICVLQLTIPYPLNLLTVNLVI